MFQMSYFYSGLGWDFIQHVDQTNGVLNVVSPDFFYIRKDGSLLLRSANPDVIKALHRRKLKVVPFLSNHWDQDLGRFALMNRVLLAKQISHAIEELDLDGVNIDIENLTEKDRNLFTDFIRLVRKSIPKHKEVSVAVAANPFGWTKGWHGSYDYEYLAKYADYLMVMAYDESRLAGPTASVGWVEKSIQYVLTQKISPQKLVLGLPFYGRCWMEGQSASQAIPLYLVDSLVKRHSGTIIFDTKSQSPKAIFTVNHDKKGPLPSGTYTLWFENEQSLRAKIKLAQKYNLKGLGSWSLGQEDVSVWNTVFKNI
ncbi:glycosyl hydrolase family 18 protein [Bacillus subtilis]|uniref:glycosyl hydrolase family 18 protein n=1 Tax=Bacillus subtilis TaxID=1423 RepID=UPI002DBCD2CA|nr:glycosyl hydrolase family 18 protein [Bacillus subtilis]MEC1272792.1 glycosyl hydrolase family 18 protein [Bacillus subtilis]MEC1316479.1 glycosyl hydrolase family 18 protein [Bacillus subtilis]MEC1495677.1 glycosyl hydrolase family 18 protein [Bacillus subtilis]